MKKNLLLVFFVVLSQVQINAQKESLGVFFGKPWFADADIISKNYYLSSAAIYYYISLSILLIIIFY